MSTPLFRRCCAAALCCALLQPSARVWSAEPYPDRFVWLFGWNLDRDADVAEMEQVLVQGGAHGINGAVLSTGMDTLCKQSPEYFARLAKLQAACERNHIELIPAVFSIGYGGGVLTHDRNLAEGLPVVDAPMAVQGGQAVFAGGGTAALRNGGFEDFKGDRMAGFGFHDQPGEVSFVDTTVRHGGRASLRFEHFTANEHGHGRVMQEIRVQPHRCYRVKVWAKTEQLEPVNAFRMMALAGDQELAPRQFNLAATEDWREISWLFNSLDREKVLLYAGMWGGRSGRLWLDDWRVEEVGPVNLLRRPGTPVTVRNAAGTITYTEGKDYAPWENRGFSPWRDDGAARSLSILPGGRITEGETLKVSWYHSLLVNDSQVTVCMAEPAVDEIFDHEARLLAEKVHPRRVLLNMDEVRMAGTCRACTGRDLGELLGDCVTRQARAIRRYSPGARVYVWSDMLDPNHNAHPHYYLAQGDFTGSWDHIPKDLVIAVWGGEPRAKSLDFFAQRGFATLAACYYDADDLKEVSGWLDLAHHTKGVRGMMYTPWQKKYALLPAFGDLLGGK